MMPLIYLIISCPSWGKTGENSPCPNEPTFKKILIIGSGPIIISQACEFDYSGTQACKALREEGFEIVLVNSNPATIMTDPEMAHRTYIEPVTPEIVAKIIERERPRPCCRPWAGRPVLTPLWPWPRWGSWTISGWK